MALLGGAIVAFFSGEASASPLLYRAGDGAGGRWWTAWTAHLVHFSASHLLWDAIAVGVLGWLLEKRLGAWRVAWRVLLAAPLVTWGTMHWERDVIAYGGLSGIACSLAGGFVVAVWSEDAQGRKLALLLGLGLAAKIGWEWLHTGETLFVDTGPTAMRPVVTAHVLGAAAGAIFGWRGWGDWTGARLRDATPRQASPLDDGFSAPRQGRACCPQQAAPLEAQACSGPS